MGGADYPTTAGVRFLQRLNVPFTAHLYPYEDHGGTSRAAQFLMVSEHEVVKTLVMQTDHHFPLLVLMHGDNEVSTKQLARFLGAKWVDSCDIATAQKHTGYQVGGISPFGTRKELPVYVEKTIFRLPHIYINGGKRGFLVGIDPKVLRTVLNITEVEVALP